MYLRHQSSSYCSNTLYRLHRIFWNVTASRMRMPITNPAVIECIYSPLRCSQIYFEITDNGFEIILELSAEKITANERPSRLFVFARRYFVSSRSLFDAAAAVCNPRVFATRARENKGTIRGKCAAYLTPAESATRCFTEIGPLRFNFPQTTRTFFYTRK